MDQGQENMNDVTVGKGKSGSGGSLGLFIGVIVILAIVILGGYYFWQQRTDEGALQEEIQEDETMNSINNQSGSDNTSSIESDLEATDVDNLDAELHAS